MAAELPSVDEETGRRIEPPVVSRSAAEHLRYVLGRELLQHLQATASSQEDRTLLQSSNPSLNTIRPGVRLILDRFQHAGECHPFDHHWAAGHCRPHHCRPQNMTLSCLQNQWHLEKRNLINHLSPDPLLKCVILLKLLMGLCWVKSLPALHRLHVICSRSSAAWLQHQDHDLQVSLCASMETETHSKCPHLVTLLIHFCIKELLFGDLILVSSLKCEKT